MSDKRLIDANALHKRIEMNLRASNPFTIEECCYKDALNSVDEAPTIDPESLPPYWRKTAEDPPTREDGNEIGSILCAGYHCNIRDGMWLENIMPWHVVRGNPGDVPALDAAPKLPDLPVPERRCMMGND